MAIDVHCKHCGKKMRVKDSFAGTKGLCPFCKAEITVPAIASPSNAPTRVHPVEPKSDATTPKQSESKPPTEKQLEYARDLGIQIPENVTRQQLSRMIDEAIDNAPATEGQKEFLRNLGVKIPDDIRRQQMSMLLDAALDLKSQVQEEARREIKEYEIADLISQASFEQLLEGLKERGKPFFLFTLEDDEFRYKDNVPIKGDLSWTDDLNPADVQWIILNLTSAWANKLDLEWYQNEFDNELPKVSFSIDVSDEEAARLMSITDARVVDADDI
jgi:hypothetical protein